MKVRDVMTKSPSCCTPDTKLGEVARMMVDQDCGAIPVAEDNDSKKPAGIITDRDIVCRAVAENKNPLEMTAKDCMTPSVVTTTPDAALEECCQQMEDKQVRRVLVVEQSGECCGIVAQADVAVAGDRQETAEVVQHVSQPA